MRIVIDINHPAHVHYFKNFIFEMKKRGHEVQVTASQKDITFRLLEKYHIEFKNVGNYGNSFMRKLINIPLIDLRYYRLMKAFKPDIFLGFGSIRAAHVSFLLQKPCINFEDTENSTEQIRLYLPFVKAVCTPSCYSQDLGKKHIRFKGYMELAALHSHYFTPNPAVLREIGITENDPLIIVRFVSWEASHDVGHNGLSLDIKRKAISEFKKYGRVLITSEKPLPEEFEKYRISVSPEKMHDLLFYATLLYGESATMASECAVLGTHAIFCDFAGRGYTDEEESKYHLVYNFRLDKESQERSIEKALELLQNPHLKEISRQKQAILLRDKIDVTAFMVWFIEGYPDSVGIMKNTPGIQKQFGQD
jgi:predicted glycosyltransferase